MSRPRPIELFVAGWFLAVVFGVPLAQVVREARRGEVPQAFDVFRRTPTRVQLRAYEQDLEEASWVAGALRPWMQWAQFRFLQDAGDQALVGRDGWLFYQPGVRYLTQRPPARSGGTGVNEALTAIVSFRDQLAASGMHLVLVLAPNKESIYPEMLTSRSGRLPTIPGRATRELVQQLEAADVEIVDLFQWYREARQTGGLGPTGPLYLAQDSHWSPAGARLAARAAAARILERGWINPGAVQFDLRSVSIRPPGDVLRMLRVPRLEQALRPRDLPCDQVIRAADGTPYADDPASEVLVLGDSFLRIYEQDDPGSAGFIAHLARELKRPVASLVNDGGASTLVRQELNRRPGLLRNKKVVVWEFVERDIYLGLEGWQVVPLPPVPTLP